MSGEIGDEIIKRFAGRGFEVNFNWVYIINKLINCSG